MWCAIILLLLCSHAQALQIDQKTQQKQHYDKLSEPLFKQFMKDGGYAYGQPVEVRQGEHPYLVLLIDDNHPGSIQDKALAACLLIAPKAVMCTTGYWPKNYKFRLLMNHQVDENTVPLEILNADPWVYSDWMGSLWSPRDMMVFSLKEPVRFNHQRSLITFHQRYSLTPFMDDDHQNWDPSWFLLKQATWMYSGSGFVRAEVPMTLAPSEGNPESVEDYSVVYTYIVEQMSRNDNKAQHYATHPTDIGAPLLAGYGATSVRVLSKNSTSRYGLGLNFKEDIFPMTTVVEFYDHSIMPMPVDKYNLKDEEQELSRRTWTLSGPLDPEEFVDEEDESYRYDEIKKRDCEYSAS